MLILLKEDEKQIDNDQLRILIGLEEKTVPVFKISYSERIEKQLFGIQYLSQYFQS